MAVATKTIYEAVKTAIEASLSIRVYAAVPDSPNQLPAAVLIPATYDPIITFGGTQAQYTMTILIYTGSANSQDAWRKAMDYLDNEDARSLDSAIEADPTLGGNVTRAFIRSGNSMTREAFGGGDYVVTEFTLEYWRG
jgi:hypothetical protein